MILLRLISWPYFRKHVLRTMLTIAGIVLGVAVFVGMHTANQSVLFAFSRTVDRIAGKTEIQVTAGEAGFEEDILEKVQSASSVRVAVPVIEAVVDTRIGGRGQPAGARRGHDGRPQPSRLRPRERRRGGHRRSAGLSGPARLDHPDEAVRREEPSRRQRPDPARHGRGREAVHRPRDHEDRRDDERVRRQPRHHGRLRRAEDVRPRADVRSDRPRRQAGAHDRGVRARADRRCSAGISDRAAVRAAVSSSRRCWRPTR